MPTSIFFDLTYLQFVTETDKNTLYCDFMSHIIFVIFYES